jgi:hypothetical protein
MQIRQNYSLKLELVQRLNREVTNGSKSAYVEKAILRQMNGQDSWSLSDYSDEFLLEFILSRNWNRDGTNNLDPILVLKIKEIVARKKE